MPHHPVIPECPQEGPMYSNPEQFTEAYSVATGEKQTVPLNYLGPDSPFPGQWRKTDPKNDSKAPAPKEKN